MSTIAAANALPGAQDAPLQDEDARRLPIGGEIDVLVANGLQALAAYEAFTQEQVDHIVKKASVAALDRHGALALAAIAETGRGVFEDKAVKNIFACEHVTNSMEKTKTVGVISRDDINGITEIAEPVGVIFALVPVTNPAPTLSGLARS